ncbi:MAG: hypothetical protein XXXJIFNMEKO3_00459 [Candidatus Erwinia impunctatus]|nr:hypothetical protein XXXJIFNMEKO_00459 [Culicoides impunctatus]
MQLEEQQLIEGLFNRLKQAESQSAPCDSEAEKLIQQQLQRQPQAPYYMAQAILIQEAALKQLNARVEELEKRLAQAPQQSSGGFLSGLFGGTGTPTAQTTPAGNAWNNNPPAPQSAPAAPASSGRGFLGGALQTAAGVAGGVVIADMLTSMFHHSQPEEIVNIINEPSPPAEEFDRGADNFNSQDDNRYDAQDAGWQDYGNDDNSSDDDGGFI